MPSHDNITPIRPGVGVRNIPLYRMARATNDTQMQAADPDPEPVDPYAWLNRQRSHLTLGERLVDFFETRGDRLFFMLIGATIGLFLADALVLIGRAW